MTDLPQTQHSVFSYFDSAPLACVMAQVGAALQRATYLLFEASAREPQQRAQSLQDASLHLQQAGSALQGAKVEGVALLTQAGELALQRFSDGTLDCSAEHAQTVGDLVHALSDYLDQLVSGAPAQPVRLFPYFRPLQMLLGSARAHPADLFFPDLTLEVIIAPAGCLIAADYPAWRQRFEQSLLPFLKEGAPAARLQHAGALRDVVAQVAQAQTEASARTFWHALLGFAELVAGGQLASSLYVKQLFGLINLQMRRQSQGASELPDTMLRDALFFIAVHAAPIGQAAVQTAEQGASVLRQLQWGYRLAGMVPPDFELKRYGRVKPDDAPPAAAGPDGALQDAATQDAATQDVTLQEAGSQGAAPPSNVIGFPLTSATNPAQGEHMKQIGTLTISVAAHGAYLSGTDLLLRMLSQDFGEWRHEQQRAASGGAMLALRTLASTSGAIGFHAMRQLAQALEMALRGLRGCAPPQPVLDPAQRDVLEQVLQRAESMLNDFALGDMPAGQNELVAALQQLRAQLQTMPQPRPQSIDKSRVDQPMIEQGLRGKPAGAEPVPSEPALSQAALSQAADETMAQVDPVAAPVPGAIPRVALVRVRADILERIAAQAGAVSHTHARLEDDVVTLRSALFDFSENLIRLRRQLRDVELQAEAQIASRMAIAKAGEFDPLEFDRCARLQELTRIMADSVNDVAGVHRSLVHGVELASRDLQQQAGSTRAMQSELQSVRTLPIDGGARRRRHQAGGAQALTTA